MSNNPGAPNIANATKAVSTGDVSSTPSSPLFRLPTEIVTQICGHAPQAIMNMRLACKDLLNSTERAFLTCHFEELAVCAHPASLARLADIVATPKFASAIKKLDVLCAGRLADLEWSDDEDLRDTGLVREDLTEILPKLPSLERLAVTAPGKFASEHLFDWYAWKLTSEDKVVGRSAIDGDFLLYWPAKATAEDVLSQEGIPLCSYIILDVLCTAPLAPRAGLELLAGDHYRSLSIQVVAGIMSSVPCSQLLAPGVTKLDICIPFEVNVESEDNILAVVKDGTCLDGGSAIDRTNVLNKFFAHYPNLKELRFRELLYTFPTSLPPNIRVLEIMTFYADDKTTYNNLLTCIRSLRSLETLMMDLDFLMEICWHSEVPESVYKEFLLDLKHAIPDSLNRLEIDSSSEMCLGPCGDGKDPDEWKGFESKSPLTIKDDLTEAALRVHHGHDKET